jgi:hypothetical protein
VCVTTSITPPESRTPAGMPLAVTGTLEVIDSPDAMRWKSTLSGLRVIGCVSMVRSSTESAAPPIVAGTTWLRLPERISSVSCFSSIVIGVAVP